MIGVAILNIIVTLVVGFLVIDLKHATVNPVVPGTADQSTSAGTAAE